MYLAFIYWRVKGSWGYTVATQVSIPKVGRWEKWRLILSGWIPHLLSDPSLWPETTHLESRPNPASALNHRGKLAQLLYLPLGDYFKMSNFPAGCFVTKRNTWVKIYIESKCLIWTNQYFSIFSKLPKTQAKCCFPLFSTIPELDKHCENSRDILWVSRRHARMDPCGRHGRTGGWTGFYTLEESPLSTQELNLTIWTNEKCNY